MDRREFIKTLSLACSVALFPSLASGDSSIESVDFNMSRFNRNDAQTIIIYLYGGASELAGNLTNIDEIKEDSQSDYDDYFRGITLTSNKFWQEAGGSAMERMVSNGDLTVFRTCFSQLRWDDNNKSHGICTSQNQRGIYNEDDTSGIVANLAHVLHTKGAINDNSMMPFITMQGDAIFFNARDFSLESYLKPIAINSSLSNPYKREREREWYYYNSEERQVSNYVDNARAKIDVDMDELAQLKNRDGKIKENFSRREVLHSFIEDMKNATLPNNITYPSNNEFADRLKTAVNIMVNNPDTKVINMSSAGLGGWDDHNEARDYPVRMESLMIAIESAIDHIKAEGKINNINIMVFSEFGRGVNLNSAKGWDHGNLQSFYLFGGKRYINHRGVVGETELYNTGAINRMYLRPKEDSYWFEPFSIASTLYYIYGIDNPELLTGGHEKIQV